jgi:hypothetical protein
MNVLPVIARELRASARQPFTYYVRALGATALLLASLLFGVYQGFEMGMGRRLFGALHCTLFCAIWVLVPMLTADCISRERREGTLGLLFLTPLKGTDIVVAKGLAQGLRALTLGLAVVPVLTIPFLLGGGQPDRSLDVGRGQRQCDVLGAGGRLAGLGLEQSLAASASGSSLSGRRLLPDPGNRGGLVCAAGFWGDLSASVRRELG